MGTKKRFVDKKLSAVLQQAAPAALAGMPSWATGEKETGNGNGLDSPDGRNKGSKEGSSAVGDGADKSEGVSTAHDAAGSLARELRQKIFDLEAQVVELQGELSESREMMRRVGGGVGGGAAASDGRGEQRMKNFLFFS